jgi:hypothetical protein
VFSILFLFHYAGRIAYHCYTGRDILDHDGTHTNDRVISNGKPLTYHSARTDIRSMTDLHITVALDTGSKSDEVTDHTIVLNVRV